jgi:hypothetical protein
LIIKEILQQRDKALLIIKELGFFITKLVYEMKRRDAKHALAVACIGGGQGIAFILER